MESQILAELAVPNRNVRATHKLPEREEKRQVVWLVVTFFLYLHVGAIYGLYLVVSEAKLATLFWCYFIILISTQGTGAGVHRLWAHRTYKAKLPLRILLCVYQTITFQKDIYNWVRDHRGHHKYSDTDSDPHNASKGFFYSHIGWLMLKKSTQVISRGKELDLSDLEADSVVMFQRKYYWILSPFLAIIFPSIVPWYFWKESFCVSWYVCNILRYCLTFNGTCLVNSAAHIFGNRPYNRNIRPTENMLVSHITNGEGFHNYHHAFPWDYKAAELGSYYGNLSTAFIDLMAKIGWAYDLKTATPELVKKRILRTGDGSYRISKTNEWGWGDKDMSQDDLQLAKIIYPCKSG